MAFDWIKRETKSFYIARPPEDAHRLVYLHPDRSVPRGTKLTVRTDECALFFREGQFIGRVEAGTTLLDTANIPFLGHLLVDGFTGSNHFICEIFFVTLREFIEAVPEFEVGQFIDNNSRNVVKVLASVNYTVRVTDPSLLITGLGGQNAESGDVVRVVLAGRTATALRQSVATRAQSRAILDVVSNIDVDAIGNELVTAARAEFVPLGLDVVRAFDLRLDLDHESRDLLVQFGKLESNLAYQAKGASIANRDGFAQFNAVEGQLAAMKGLGQGLSTGNSPMILSGNFGGLGGGFAAPSSFTPQRRDFGSGSSPMSHQVSFILVDGNSEKGPYTPRQLALIIIAEGLDPQTTTIRQSDDRADISFTVDQEPLVMAEVQKRRRGTPSPPTARNVAPQPATAPSNSRMIDALSAAMQAAAADSRISPESFTALVDMAQALGLSSDQQQASLLVLGLATQAGFSVNPNNQ